MFACVVTVSFAKIPNPRQIYWQSQTNVKANGSTQQSDGDDDQRVCPGQTDKDCRDRVKDLPLQGSNDLLLVARNSVVFFNDVVDDTEILKIGRKQLLDYSSLLYILVGQSPEPILVKWLKCQFHTLNSFVIFVSVVVHSS